MAWNERLADTYSRGVAVGMQKARLIAIQAELEALEVSALEIAQRKETLLNALSDIERELKLLKF